MSRAPWGRDTARGSLQRLCCAGHGSQHSRREEGGCAGAKDTLGSGSGRAGDGDQQPWEAAVLPLAAYGDTGQGG